MRILVHLSDLHFGRTDPAVLEPLLAFVAAAEPHCVVISGDLTQRARPKEFQEARAFLDRLPAPQVVVPGNHDVPLFDVPRRFLRPLHRFRDLISEDLSPFYEDDVVAVLGVNTARSLTWKEGRLSHEQIDMLQSRFAAVGDARMKVLFTHHPFLPPAHARETSLVGRHKRALEALEAAGVDVLLAGHLHLAYAEDVVGHHDFVTRSILVAQAGTATSHRTRGEPNAYNLIELGDERVQIEVRTSTGRRFESALTNTWRRVGHRFVEERLTRGPALVAHRPDVGAVP